MSYVIDTVNLDIECPMCGKCTTEQISTALLFSHGMQLANQMCADCQEQIAMEEEDDAP